MVNALMPEICMKAKPQAIEIRKLLGAKESEGKESEGKARHSLGEEVISVWIYL